MTTTMTIFAQALIDNRNYKNAKINGEAVGVTNARLWANAVKACRLPAYAIRSARYNAMGNAEDVTIDQSPLYDAIRPVIDLIGEINGRKLNSKNVAEELIANVMKFRVIDTSVEMADARFQYRQAKKDFEENPSDEKATLVDTLKEEVKRLEGLPGNCKRIPEIVSESAFVKAVEIVLGDVVKGESIKTAEQVKAEEDAKKAAAKAKKQAKRQAAAIAKKAEAEAEKVA